MSQSQNIQNRTDTTIAPTPQNTPLNTTSLSSRPAGLAQPQVEDIGEAEDEEGDDGGEDVGGINPASLLARVRVSEWMCREIFWNGALA